MSSNDLYVCTIICYKKVDQENKRNKIHNFLIQTLHKIRNDSMLTKTKRKQGKRKKKKEKKRQNQNKTF